jgi:hypothetical protein
MIGRVLGRRILFSVLFSVLEAGLKAENPFSLIGGVAATQRRILNTP